MCTYRGPVISFTADIQQRSLGQEGPWCTWQYKGTAAPRPQLSPNSQISRCHNLRQKARCNIPLAEGATEATRSWQLIGSGWWFIFRELLSREMLSYKKKPAGGTGQDAPCCVSQACCSPLSPRSPGAAPLPSPPAGLLRSQPTRQEGPKQSEIQLHKAGSCIIKTALLS